jgi:putative protease
MIAGRSANRGACIQACRSRYDLVDATGKVLVKDKALLSLKDYNLRGRLRELAEAGITSFKIEGRLKNESYVRNVVRDYSIALDRLIENNPSEYERESFGRVSGGFTPDTDKTFNRGYTELFLDGKRGKWAAMDAAKSMGEMVGTVASVSRNSIEVRLNKDVVLGNGDGFSFVSKSGKVEGFRGDVCSGSTIRCKILPTLFAGAVLYRNINAAFEKEIERQACTREIGVSVTLNFPYRDGQWTLHASATTEDGRKVEAVSEPLDQKADNQERMSGMLESQICKSTGHYRFSLSEVNAPDGLPFMSASALNGIRRAIAEQLDITPAIARKLLNRPLEGLRIAPFPEKNVTYKQNVSNRLSADVYASAGVGAIEDAYELSHRKGAELMRTKYCIRYELGLCPIRQNAKQSAPLFLLNNGKRLALHFDCRRCEMTVTEA